MSDSSDASSSDRHSEDGPTREQQRLCEAIYDELRRQAKLALAGERSDHTLQPTALVHEAYIRLLGSGAPAPSDRAGFFAAAVVAIRRVLIDHARRRGRQKRGGGRSRRMVDLDEIPDSLEDEDLLALDVALGRFAKVDPRKAHLVELRFFAGLSIEEAAAVLGTSPTTVQRDWRLARAWLSNAIRTDS